MSHFPYDCKPYRNGCVQQSGPLILSGFENSTDEVDAHIICSQRATNSLLLSACLQASGRTIFLVGLFGRRLAFVVDIVITEAARPTERSLQSASAEYQS